MSQKEKVIILISGEKPGTGATTLAHGLHERLHQALTGKESKKNSMISAGSFRRALALAWRQAQTTQRSWQSFFQDFYQQDPSVIYEKIAPYLHQPCDEETLAAFTHAQITRTAIDDDARYFWDGLPEQLAYLFLLKDENKVTIYEGKLATEILEIFGQVVPQNLVVLKVFLQVDDFHSALRVLKREVMQGSRVHPQLFSRKQLTPEQLISWFDNPKFSLPVNDVELTELFSWKEQQIAELIETNRKRIADDAQRYAQVYPSYSSEPTSYMLANRIDRKSTEQLMVVVDTSNASSDQVVLQVWEVVKQTLDVDN